MITSGAANQKTTLAAASRTTDRLITAEIARQASLSDRVVRRSTNTGMKVADRTPPMTMSYSMFGAVLARLKPSASGVAPSA